MGYAEIYRGWKADPEGFWRKGNVDIVAKRYGIATAKDLDDLASQALKFEA